jgi:hypothetical protein
MTDGYLFTRLTRPARLAVLLLVLATSLGLVACGGDDDEQEIEDVAIGYGESDGAEACDFLSSSALDQLGGESGCTRTFEEVPPAEFEVEEIDVEDESATAQVLNVESDQTIELGFVKEEDEWKISSFPGLETLQPPEETDTGETTTEGTTTEETETETEGDETETEDEEGP